MENYEGSKSHLSQNSHLCSKLMAVEFIQCVLWLFYSIFGISHKSQKSNFTGDTKNGLRTFWYQKLYSIKIAYVTKVQFLGQISDCSFHTMCIGTFWFHFWNKTCFEKSAFKDILISNHRYIMFIFIYNLHYSIYKIIK